MSATPAILPTHVTPDPATWTGLQVFIETVTYHYTGTLSHVDFNHFCLTDVTKIMESGPLDDFTAGGDPSNAEKYHPEFIQLIPRGACTAIGLFPNQAQLELG